MPPFAAEAVSDTTPRVRWSPFRSPEHVSFEARTLSVYVSRDLGGGREATAWDFFTTAPAELGELSVGGTLGEGKSPLEAGDHWLALTAGEQRFFGPLRLVRASRTVQSFHVVP